MNIKTIIKFIVFIVVSLLITLAAMQLPQVQAFAGPDGQYLPAIVATFVPAFTQVVAVYYFLASVKTFKQDLRVAFYFVAIGLFVFSFLQLASVAQVFVTIDNVLLSNGLIIVPYALGGILIFFGVRKFSKLLGVDDRWSSPLVAVIFSLALALLFIVLPHLPVPGLPDSTLFPIIGSAVWCGGLSIFTAILAFRIRQVISPIYKTAMLWLGIAMAEIAFTIFHELLTKFYVVVDWPNYVGNIGTWPFMLNGILFLGAGLAFKEAGRRFVQLPPKASPIDIITTMAQLVSKPKDIDPELDKIRVLTASKSVEQFTKADYSTIREVYLKIEDYLLHQERLRTFTREELRADLPSEFLSNLEPQTAGSNAKA